MKLQSLLEDADPIIELTKFTEPFDCDLLGEMIDAHDARVFINGQDLDSIFYEIKYDVARKAVKTFDDPETGHVHDISDVKGGSPAGPYPKVLYNLKTHLLYVECDLIIDVQNQRSRQESSFVIPDSDEGFDESYEVKIGTKRIIVVERAMPTMSNDIVDLTELFKKYYAYS